MPRHHLFFLFLVGVPGRKFQKKEYYLQVKLDSTKRVWERKINIAEFASINEQETTKEFICHPSV